MEQISERNVEPMMEPTYESIYSQATVVFTELIQSADTLRPGDIVVIGCSTSEIMGKCIGSASSVTAAKAVMDAVYPIVKARGLFLAVQCCEHLNRCLVVERECLDRYDLQQVWVRPQLHAGGAFAMQAMERFSEPVMAEDLRAKASAGMDIGGTLIGMHMHPVVVPVHTKHRHIGCAYVNIARTRPKYVGGPRAQYDEDPHSPAHKGTSPQNEASSENKTEETQKSAEYPEWLYETEGDAYAHRKNDPNWGRDLFCAETSRALTDEEGGNQEWKKYIGRDWD